MSEKLNSYGKTWHLWHTGGPGREADALPFGPPSLAWSFNRDGEADPAMVAERDRALGVDTAARRAQRADLCALARPQRGVDVLRDAFPRADGRPAGVAEQGA